MLTHRNIVANVLQAESWIGTSARVGQDTIITALPLYQHLRAHRKLGWCS